MQSTLPTHFVSTTRTASAKSIYQIVTDEIIKKLDAGTVPWRQPWVGGEMPQNFITKRPYGGINAFLLWCSEYPHPYWLTFNQCVKAGGSVKKGEKGTLVVFWKKFPMVKVTNEKTGEEEDKVGFMLRYFKVFNVSQCDGLTIPVKEARKTISPIVKCDALMIGYTDRPEVAVGGQRATYNTKTDVVNIPEQKSFHKDEQFYATLFHEFTHSTGAAKRLNRKGVAGEHKIFGSEDYSKEELIAEFGSAFLCAHAGIMPTTLADSASYIDHWKKELQADSRLLVSAASQAQKAANYILQIPSLSSNGQAA